MVSGIFLLTCVLLVGPAFAHRSLSGNEQVKKELNDMKETSSGQNTTASKGNQDVNGAVAALEDKLRAMESLLLATRAEQKTTRRKLQTTKRELQTTKRDLHREHRTTKRELQREQQTAKRELQREQQTTKRKLQRELQTTKRDLQTTKRDLQANKKERQIALQSESTTFIRWGNSYCTAPNKLVYRGRIVGKAYFVQGSGTNPLCFQMKPRFDFKNPRFPKNFVFGAHFWNSAEKAWHDYLTCAICEVPMSTTIMVPGTDTCPSGWTTQYKGILVAGNNQHFTIQYICLEKNHEKSPVKLRYSKVCSFYNVAVKCASLPCPPYDGDKALWCVVCSK